MFDLELYHESYVVDVSGSSVDIGPIRVSVKPAVVSSQSYQAVLRALSSNANNSIEIEFCLRDGGEVKIWRADSGSIDPSRVPDVSTLNPL